MIDGSTTTTLLLDGLLNERDETAWRRFDARYRPIIEALARKLGLNEEEAADAAQDTLLRFIKSFRAGQYDRSRGRLRAWIITIVKYRVADIKSAKAARRENRGDSAFLQLPTDDHLEALWDEESRREILRLAIQELRSTSKTSEKSIDAFEMLVWKEIPAPSVAEQLGMTLHDVYMAKRRVTDRLRKIVERLEALYQDGA